MVRWRIRKARRKHLVGYLVKHSFIKLRKLKQNLRSMINSILRMVENILLWTLKTLFSSFEMSNSSQNTGSELCYSEAAKSLFEDDLLPKSYSKTSTKEMLWVFTLLVSTLSLLV